MPFIDRARARGAEQVVFLSVTGADSNRWVPHHAVERYLREAPGPYTILRPGFFAQNLQDAYRRDLVEADRLYIPAGQGRAAFVDLADVAAVAAEAFADPAAHDRCGHTLTGPEALGMGEVADILSAVLERPIRYEPASILGYGRHLKSRGMPWAQIAVQTVLHVGLRFGQAERVDPTLERILGRPARTMETYIQENADIWARVR